MGERWDVIVVGCGLGGLLAAAMLGRSGRRVLALERLPDVGGRLRSHDADGFVLDAGAFLWPNRHLDAALAAAGVTEFRASAVPPARLMRLYVEGTGGTRFAFPWPGRPESPRLLATARVALGADPQTFRAVVELWDHLGALPDEAVQPLMHRTVREALPELLPDPRAAEAFCRHVMLFGTYDPGAASMGEWIRMLRRNRAAEDAAKAECPGANPLGGVRALPAAIRAAVQAAGVELRVAHTVEHVVIEAGRVTGVYAHGGAPFLQHFAAPVVVVNVPIWQVFDLVAPDHFPPAFVASARRYAAVGGTINAAFAFDGLPCLRETGEPDAFPGWTRLLVGADRGFGGGMLWTTLHSPRNAPPGQHVLQAMRLSPRADVADWQRAGRIVTAFRTMLDELYADVGEKLLWARAWVTRDGSEYLISAAPRPPVEAPAVAGLYFVGETTDVPAVQMDAAALSALRCAELLGHTGADAGRQA